MISLLYAFLFLLITFIILVITIVILAKRTEDFDLSQESEDLKNNNKNK